MINKVLNSKVKESVKGRLDWMALRNDFYVGLSIIKIVVNCGDHSDEIITILWCYWSYWPLYKLILYHYFNYLIDKY